MLQIRRSQGGGDQLEFLARLPWGTRLLLAGAGLVTLTASWQLFRVIGPRGVPNPAGGLFLLLSAGALGLGILLLVAALLGQSTRLTFDPTQAWLVFERRTSLLPPSIRVVPFSEIAGVSVTAHERSDGPPSFALAIQLIDGDPLTSGTSQSRPEIEGLRAEVVALLARGRDRATPRSEVVPHADRTAE